jgi:hypothetical protein
MAMTASAFFCFSSGFGRNGLPRRSEMWTLNSRGLALVYGYARRNASSAVKQHGPNHPGDLPFLVVAAPDTNHAAKVKLHDFILCAAGDEKGGEFAEKRQVADDHHVAAGLFERFFCYCNLVFWPKTFALYNPIPSPDRRREQFSGLLRACFATVPNDIDREVQRAQKIGNLLHIGDSFVCQSALRVFFFGSRFSVLNQIDTHDCCLPFTPALLRLTRTGCE